MSDANLIIKRPLFTEKATALKENENKLLIEVDIKANKIEIKKAFERQFNVKVEKISTLIEPRKWKRLGKSIGRSPKMKKAVITLKEGQKLDFIEGV
ncbi:50S ribosomal protein L23 [Candidatus Magnetoovum chiemensis]|nr:50S ribosomal protein L23 [Candidatus Magnetoovum chiemensis]